jgi:hypothetical protein
MSQNTQTLQKPVVLPDRTDKDYIKAIIVLEVIYNNCYYTNKIIKEREE